MSMKVDQKTANPESVGQEAVVNETSAPNPAKRSNAKKKKGASGELIFWRITSSLLLLAVITLAVMLHLSKAGMLPSRKRKPRQKLRPVIPPGVTHPSANRRPLRRTRTGRLSSRRGRRSTDIPS